MCRLLGIIAAEPTPFGLLLTEAPRCLATLSREHPDGWGIAIHESSWRLNKGTERAAECRRFNEIATQTHGHVLIAHVRQKTVGPTRIENTHPFESSGWVFAHNGTIQRCDHLRANTSEARLQTIRGETDSELLFAYLLTKLDAHGLTHLGDEASRDAATNVLEDATRELRAANVGAFNFLMSDGVSCFTHRFGRSLYFLERGPRDVGTGPNKWIARRSAILVASERITDENWIEIADGTLLRIDRGDQTRVARVSEAPHHAA